MPEWHLFTVWKLKQDGKPGIPESQKILPLCTGTLMTMRATTVWVFIGWGGVATHFRQIGKSVNMGKKENQLLCDN